MLLAITSVSLVRLMATTHHYDANQRLVWLQIMGKVQVRYGICSDKCQHRTSWILYDSCLELVWVPSIAKVIAIPGTAQPPDANPPSQVIGLGATAVGGARLIWFGLQTHKQMGLLIITSIEALQQDSL